MHHHHTVVVVDQETYAAHQLGQTLFVLFLLALGVVWLAWRMITVAVCGQATCKPSYIPGPPMTVEQIAARDVDLAQAKAEVIQACKSLPSGKLASVTKQHAGYAIMCGMLAPDTENFIPASDVPVEFQQARHQEFADACRVEGKYVGFHFKAKAPEKLDSWVTCGIGSMPSTGVVPGKERLIARAVR